MPSVRTKFWNHQVVNGSQRGDGGNCVWTQDHFTSVGDILVGNTLLRTIVSGYFDVGISWNPAGSIPFSDVLSSVEVTFGVYCDTTSSVLTDPPVLTDTSREQQYVWMNTLAKGPTTSVDGVGNGRLAVARFELPQGPLSESYARRGPAIGTVSQLWLNWRIWSKYATTAADFIAGYSVGGVAWNWMLGGSITVDSLFEGPA